MMCEHEGEIVGHVELHKLDGDWAAHGFIKGRVHPESVVISDDPYMALQDAAYEVAESVKEVA